MSGVFHYANPLTIYWGPGSLERLAPELDRLNVRRPFLVSTRSLSENASLSGRLRAALGRDVAGTPWNIRQHAPQADIEAAVEAARESRADGVVSFGGGSPIDAGKIVAFDTPETDASRPLPHVAIPTTLSAAELSSSAGVTDESGRKGGKRDPRMVPNAVIYDADLTLATPPELWLASGIRALDHAVESILWPGEHPYSDTLALEAIRRLFRSLPAAKAAPGDLAVRTENQLGAWFSYSLPQVAGGLSHMLGKQIGAPYGIPHGVTSCLLLPHVMRYLCGSAPARLALMAPAMGVPAGGGEAEQARAAADGVYELIASLGLPQHLSAYRLTDQQLREAAEPLARDYPLEDLIAIYQAAR